MTTTANFEMSQEALQIGDKIEIVAERPLIEKDGVTTMQVTEAEVVENMVADDFKDALTLNFGAEYSFSNRLFVRGGYKLNYDEESYTFGGGLNLPITNYNFMLDYSFNEFGILGETHRFSIGFRL